MANIGSGSNLIGYVFDPNGSRVERTGYTYFQSGDPAGRKETEITRALTTPGVRQTNLNPDLFQHMSLDGSKSKALRAYCSPI